MAGIIAEMQIPVHGAMSPAGARPGSEPAYVQNDADWQ